MNESSHSVDVLQPPLTAPQATARARIGASALVWLSQVFPTMLVLVALGGLAYFGHRTGWTLPRFSSLTGNGQAEKDDWCGEHGVPESLCVECNAGLLPKGREFGWCKKHRIPECAFEHPEVAQLKEKPQITADDLQRAQQALDFADRPEPNSRCKLHLRRIQFASKQAFERAGIDVEPVWTAPMVEAVSANGEITYDQTRIARLSTPVLGTVWRVEKKVGDALKQGDVLALVDAAEVGRVKAEFLQAVAQFDLRKSSMDPLKTAYSRGAVSDAKFREAEASLREARIRILSAQQALVNLGFPISAENVKGLPEEQLAAQIRFLGLPDTVSSRLDPNRTTANLIPVKAPLDGVVLAREVVAGEVVDATKTLFVVGDTRQMWLTLSVREEDTKRLHLGQPILFRPEGSGVEASGKIAWISTAVDAKTRAVKVRAELDNRDGRLRANTFGPGRIVLREEKNAVVVPTEAIQWEGDCHVVFVRDRNFLREDAPKVFHVRKIWPGARDDKYTEIIAGVLPGEVVATKGSGALRGELLKNNLGEG